MRDLCKDTGRILFMIRLFSFIFLLCKVLLCDSVKKCLDLAGVDSVQSQSELKSDFNYDISIGFNCRIHSPLFRLKKSSTNYTKCTFNPLYT